MASDNNAALLAVLTPIEAPIDEWKTGLLECCATGCGNCLLGMFCQPCAMASARSRLDGSDVLFNCCCICNPAVARNIIREGYHIRGNFVTDCLAGTLCWPCTICQVRSETKKRGPAHMQWGTNRSPSPVPWNYGIFDCCIQVNFECMLAAICPQMTFALARTRFDKSNFCFNFFLVSPCLIKSIVSHGYNIKSSDYCSNCCLVTILPWCSACQVMNEVKDRGSMTMTYVAYPVVSGLGETIVR
ncbi:unnamed protein product [Choristocarpus tenellus]